MRFIELYAFVAVTDNGGVKLKIVCCVILSRSFVDDDSK